MPAGWLAYRGVQVFDRYTGSVHVDLQPLLPRASATLVLSGGFSLPGRLRKWSSLQPPEVQVVTPHATCVRVRVDRGSRLGEPVLERKVEGNVAVVPLADADLKDGEYLITLWVDEDKKPSATSLLRLRSGDSPVREPRDVRPAWSTARLPARCGRSPRASQTERRTSTAPAAASRPVRKASRSRCHPQRPGRAGPELRARVGSSAQVVSWATAPA